MDIIGGTAHRWNKCAYLRPSAFQHPFCLLGRSALFCRPILWAAPSLALLEAQVFAQHLCLDFWSGPPIQDMQDIKKDI